MMLYPVLIMVISIASSRCEDPWECFRDNNDKCDEFQLPGDFPDTVDELRAICQNIQDHHSCLLSVKENCSYGEDILDSERETQAFVKNVCEETNPTYQTIASNLACISPAARNIDEICRIRSFSPTNYEIIESHQTRLLEEDKITEARCLESIINTSCPSVALGYFCDKNPEVTEAVQHIMSMISKKLHVTCDEETIQKVQPLYDVYEAILLEELEVKVRNATR